MHMYNKRGSCLGCVHTVNLVHCTIKCVLTSMPDLLLLPASGMYVIESSNSTNSQDDSASMHGNHGPYQTNELDITSVQ